jgi:hypothetical protein
VGAHDRFSAGPAAGIPDARAAARERTAPSGSGSVTRMRAAVTLAFMLAVLAAFPCGAGAVALEQSRWPTAAEVRAITPGLAAKDATCIAGYYHGRLSRKAWLTAYYKLTRVEKIATDAGFTHCMSLARRAALAEREDVLSFGRHPAALRCSPRREAARRRDALLSITSLAEAIRAGDDIYRACGVTGALYAALGKATLIEITGAEQACANRVGSVDPLRDRGVTPTTTQLEAVGTVFDNCVGAASKQAFLGRIFKDVRPSGAIPCVVKHAMSITFVTFFSRRADLQAKAKAASTACRVPVSGR